jgi:hypothetical protein
MVRKATQGSSAAPPLLLLLLLLQQQQPIHPSTNLRPMPQLRPDSVADSPDIAST